MKIDHVLIACADLDGSAERLLGEHGLGSVVGGRHLDWGTGNRIVPAGGEYLELFGILDHEVALGNPIGSWVAVNSADGDTLMAVCIATDDIEAVCARLDVKPMPGGRELPDGTRLAWRLAGIEAAMGHRLPFFIQWDEGHGAGSENATEGTTATAVTEVEVGGDPERLAEWLGEDVPGVSLVGGEPGLRSATIETDQGPVVLPERL